MGQNKYSRILLSQGKYAIVDTEDYEWLSKWKWTLHSQGYAYRNNREGNRTPRIIFMHRAVNKTPLHLVTDHINRNRLDNRKFNLRSVTKTANAFNTKRNKNNTTGERGVVYRSEKNKWIAQITYNHQPVYIGIYVTKEEAVVAYNAVLAFIQTLAK
jgi:hypothetical protein